LSFLSFPLLNILTTYEIAINGYYITPIVCLGCLFWGLFVLLSKVIMVTKKTRIIGAIWIIAAIVNFGLNLVLIPVIGIIGGAITTLLAFGLASVVVFHYARKEIAIELNVNFVAKSVLASLVMSLILFLWQTTDLLMVLIEIIMCAAVYFVVLFALKGFSKKEISFFMSFIPGHG